MNSLRNIFLIITLFAGTHLSSQNDTDSLTQLLNTSLEDTTRIDVLGALATQLFGVHPDQAIDFAKEASELAQKIGDQRRNAVMLKYVGIGYYYKSDFVDVMEYWKASLKVYTELNDPVGIANILSNIGAVYDSTGDYTKALTYFLEALGIAEENNDTLRKGTVLLNIGSVYSNIEDFEASKDYYQQALEICRSINYDLGIATIGMNLSEVYTHFKEFDKALASASDSRRILEKSSDPSLPEVLNRISLLHFEQGDLKEAESEALKSYALSKKNDSKAFLQGANIILGKVYRKTNRKSQAIIRFKEAIKLGQSIGVNTDLRDAYVGLVDVYKSQGQFKNASASQDSLISVTRKIYDLEQDKTFANLQLKNDIEKRESEIRQLSVENELQEVQVSRAKASRNFFMALTGLFVIGAFGFLTFLRNKKLKKDVEEKEKAAKYEKRISQALHKFVPMTFLKALGRDHILSVELGDQKEQEVTVVFTDIRSYTTIAERMTPSENFKFVKQYAEKMGPAIVGNGGFINQYLGDGIMAIFQDSPDSALKACIEMQMAVREFNQEANGIDPIRVGMGMHTGMLVMGVIGDQTRQDAALISDTVNTAARLESLTKEYGVEIILSDSTLNKLSDKGLFNFKYLGSSLVKGKVASIEIYECTDTKNLN